MGANPTGSNNKPRATLIFGTKEELELYKRLVHDIGNLRKMNAAELVMALLEEEYKTVTAKDTLEQKIETLERKVEKLEIATFQREHQYFRDGSQT